MVSGFGRPDSRTWSNHRVGIASRRGPPATGRSGARTGFTALDRWEGLRETRAQSEREGRGNFACGGCDRELPWSDVINTQPIGWFLIPNSGLPYGS